MREEGALEEMWGAMLDNEQFYDVIFEVGDPASENGTTKIKAIRQVGSRRICSKHVQCDLVLSVHRWEEYNPCFVSDFGRSESGV